MLSAGHIQKIIYKFFPFIERYHSVRQFMKFCIIGSTNVVIDFTIYFILTRFFHLYFIMANFGSFFIAVSWSFYMNKKWTFRHLDPQFLKERFVKFIITNAIGVSIQTLLLYWFVTHGHLHALLAKGAAIVIATFWNFFVSKYWVFSIRH